MHPSVPKMTKNEENRKIDRVTKALFCGIFWFNLSIF